jgi:hypothetical protein
MECKKQQNKSRCNCTYEPCSKKGACCDCLRFHLQMGELPGCCFPNEIEKTYDRSIENFVKTYQEKGPWW